MWHCHFLSEPRSRWRWVEQDKSRLDLGATTLNSCFDHKKAFMDSLDVSFVDVEYNTSISWLQVGDYLCIAPAEFGQGLFDHSKLYKRLIVFERYWTILTRFFNFESKFIFSDLFLDQGAKKKLTYEILKSIISMICTTSTTCII